MNEQALRGAGKGRQRSRRRRRARILRGLGYLVGLLMLAALILGGLAWRSCGAAATESQLALHRRSPQYRAGRFANRLPTTQAGFFAILRRWLSGAAHSEPDKPLAVVSRRAADFSNPPKSGLRLTWLGHSSLLIEIDGRRVLTDPVFSERCSPWTFYGPRRFHPPPIPLEELPALDLVLISHDHYDHLDYRTIVALNERVPRFVVPLGVGAHLAYWGVAQEKIIERDWWQSTDVADLRLIATPARHFSGRTLWDRDRTLWASWVIAGPRHRVYFSGDTAMLPQFTEIGKRYGPFDATMIEVGAYNAMWPDVHLGPEQAVQAHLMVRGRLLFPIHWGTFNLALHAWTEPVERLAVAATKYGVRWVSPRPGQWIEPAVPPAVQAWWPKLPFKTVAEDPVFSSGLQDSR